MKVGFIGTGSMGSLLVEAFVNAGAMLPEDITVSSRTRSKAEALAIRCPGLRLVDANEETARKSDILFLCVRPSEFGAVLPEIAPVLQPGQIVASITSPVTIAQLEAYLPCKVVKIIPSIVNAVRSGATLLIWGTRLSVADRAIVQELFTAISRPVEIREEDVRAASDLSSIGPAFFAYLLGAFVDAAVAQCGMDRSTAETLAPEMLLGTARLMLEQGFTPHELQARVSVPGGITAEALLQLRASTENAFEAVLRVTHEKFAVDLEKVARALRLPPVPKQ